MNSMSEKVAIVTGGSTGIGRATAIAFAIVTTDAQLNNYKENAMTIGTKPDVDEKIIRDRVKQWEAAWNVGSEKFSMERFGNLYVQDESLLAYDLTSPQTPSIIRGYDQFVQVWEPFMQAFSPWHVQVNDDVVIRVSNEIAVATFTWKVWGTVKADGQQIAADLHATLVFEKRDGKWQIVHEHISTPVRDTTSAVKDQQIRNF